MASFLYKAKKGLSEIVEGAVEAENQSEALSKIEERGLFPMSLSLQGAAAAPVEPVCSKGTGVIKKGGNVMPGELSTFIMKLATLTRARVELLASLRILHEQTTNHSFKAVILDVYNMTKEGKTFSDALAGFPGIFSPLIVNIIRAGEASGRLDTALEQINDFLMKEEAVRTKIRVALAYPMLLFSVGLGSVFLLLAFVVPKLRPLLMGMEKKLPLMTKCVMQISLVVNKSWGVVLVGLVLMVAVVYWNKEKPVVQSAFRKMGGVIPMVRKLSRDQELVRFTSALTLLLKSGVPALTAFEIAVPTMEDEATRQGLSRACKLIAAGESIAKALQSQTKLPEFFIKMIAIGEESGRLVEVLEEIMHSYTQQIEADIAVVTALLEPLLILVMGTVLGGIILSILLPTFQITQFIR